MAERVGFEPTDAFTSPVFKTGSFNRSDISPNAGLQSRELSYHIKSGLSIPFAETDEYFRKKP